MKDPDFSGLPESLELELGMLGEAGHPVPVIFWLPNCLEPEFETLDSDLIEVVDLEPRISLPGPSGLLNCVEHVPGCPRLSECIELELGMLVEMEPGPELADAEPLLLLKFLEVNPGTAFPGLI